MLPGCLGAARYKVVLGDGSHQYMALYAFESAAMLSDALGGPEIRASSPPSWPTWSASSRT
jgi:hypothetical protein